MKDEKRVVISGRLQRWLDTPTIWDGEHQIDILSTIIFEFEYGEDIEITIIHRDKE